MSGMTAAAREVAGLAAAVGTNFTLDLLTEASDLDVGTVVGAVDELWRRRIMREFGDGYDFSHDLLRYTAYAQVSPPKRWLLHRRVAQALELLHADDADTVRHSSRSNMPAAGGRGGLWPVTSGQPTSRQACSPMPRRSGCTRRRCRACATCRRGKTGTGRNSKSWKPWQHRSTPGTATPHRSCSGPSNGRSTSRNHWAAKTPRSPAWSRSGRRSSFKGASLMDTRRPPVR